MAPTVRLGSDMGKIGQKYPIEGCSSAEAPHAFLSKELSGIRTFLAAVRFSRGSHPAQKRSRRDLARAKSASTSNPKLHRVRHEAKGTHQKKVTWHASYELENLQLQLLVPSIGQ